MKTLAKYLGGSISYGLSTPESDLDERYVFIHTEYSKILGLERHEHQCRQTDSEDVFGWELRHFLNLLKNGNTSCLEMLYNDTWLEITDDWKYIQSYKTRLIDSHKLYKCLRGYCQSERKLVLGERTGVLGGKRRSHLDLYGFSFKNAVQFFRLCLCGKVFFQEGYFPVNIRKIDTDGLLFDIKTNPGQYNRDQIIELMKNYENLLDDSYQSIKVIYEYDAKIANTICYELYMPILKEIEMYS